MHVNLFFQSLTVIANGPYESKPVLSGLYLRFLEREPHTPISPTLYAATKEIGEVRIMEIKGTSDTAQVIELPEAETFYLVYQFMGNSVMTASGSHQLKSTQHIGCCTGPSEKLICRIDRGKTWMLLIAISGRALRTMFAEFATLAGEPRAALPIGFRQKTLFEKIQQLKSGTYTLDIKLNYYIALLIEQYQSDLGSRMKAVDNSDIALYHKAAAYIQAHYMERKLTRKQIADALCVSVRTLTRAFEDRQVKISRAIQMARLHDARERLRTDINGTVETIASTLHFADSQQFEQCYKELFKISPEKERSRRR